MDDFTIFWTGKYYQSWENKAHSHSFYQMVSAQKGNCVIDIGNETFATVPNQIFIIPPQTQHSIRMLPDTAMPQLLDIKFSISNEDYLRDLERLPACVEARDFSHFQSYFECIMRESEQRKAHYYQRICCYFGLLLTDILRDSLDTAVDLPALSAVPDGSTYNGIDMDVLLSYIEQNCASSITLGELASIANVSKTTLIHAFRESYDTTPIKYINTVRTSRAKQLLETTDLTVSDISEIIGFQSIHYFSRYFKAREGVSPSEYRQHFAKSHFYTYGEPLSDDETVLADEE